MNRIVKGLLATCAAGLLAVPATAQQAQVDGEFSLQGRLTTGTSNEAVADGQHTLTINIYNEASGAVIATETDVVTTVDGIFTTMIGDDSELNLEADGSYEIGVTVNGGAELSPRIMIGDAPSAIVADLAGTANLALDAEAVSGFRVSANGQIGPNQIVTTDAEGRLNASLLEGAIDAALEGNLVTSINGATGAVNLNVNGSGISLDDDGQGNLTLNFTGTGGGTGDFTLPFSGTAAVGNGSTAFSLTSTGAGSAATFINTNTGSALNLRGQGSGSAALNVENTGGAAIDATGSVAGGAVLELQNTSANASAELVNALNASGQAVFNVGADGSTMIMATGNDALEIIGTGGTSRFSVMADGSTTIDATGSTALSLASDAEAALSLQSTAQGSASALIEGLNAANSTVFEVAGDGQTTINTSAANALDVTTSAANGAALRLQNSAQNVNARLISALNASGNTAFEVMGNGSTNINVTGAEALNLTSNGSATLKLTNTASGNTGLLINAVNGANTAVFDVAANGQTRVNATVANALDVSTSAANGAALRVRNTAQGSTTGLISAVDAGGNAVFQVMGNGRTTISSSVEDALEVSTSASGGTALRVAGGLELPQAVGTGTLQAGSLTTTINNATVRANSVIMLTINSAANITNGLRVSNVGNGSFTVSLLDTTLGALAGNVQFNYLIINQ